MKIHKIRHEFVEYVPLDLADGVLYISIPYTVAVHKCPCGCQIKIATPITPADWQLHFDGDTVSLTPSIGNWGLPCRSHYWITGNRIVWSRSWSTERSEAARRRDDDDLREYLATRPGPAASEGSEGSKDRARRWWRR